MKAHEIKKELKGLPHIKTVWLAENGDYYTVAVRGTVPLDLTEEIAEPSPVKETVESITQFKPETATKKQKPK
jgi:hypothetical protein